MDSRIRAGQEHLADHLRQRGVARIGTAELMHEADPQRLFRCKALAAKEIAAQAARAHRTQEEWNERPWREAEPHLRQREEGALRRDDHIAAGNHRHCATDAGAVHERNRRLRHGVEREAKRGNRHARCNLGRVVLASDIRARAEVLARPAQHDGAYGSIGAQPRDLIVQSVEHRLVMAVALLRPVENESRDPVRIDRAQQRCAGRRRLGGGRLRRHRQALNVASPLLSTMSLRPSARH